MEEINKTKEHKQREKREKKDYLLFILFMIPQPERLGEREERRKTREVTLAEGIKEIEQ